MMQCTIHVFCLMVTQKNVHLVFIFWCNWHINSLYCKIYRRILTLTQIFTYEYQYPWIYFCWFFMLQALTPTLAMVFSLGFHCPMISCWGWTMQSLLGYHWCFLAVTKQLYEWFILPIQGLTLSIWLTCPSGTWFWKFTCPAKNFMCPANICKAL